MRHRFISPMMLFRPVRIHSC